MTNLTPNQAAAQAIQLFSQEARLCDGTQPNKVARTTLEPGPASLAKSLPVKSVNPTCSDEGIDAKLDRMKRGFEVLASRVQTFTDPLETVDSNPAKKLRVDSKHVAFGPRTVFRTTGSRDNIPNTSSEGVSRPDEGVGQTPRSARSGRSNFTIPNSCGRQSRGSVASAPSVRTSSPKSVSSLRRNYAKSVSPGRTGIVGFETRRRRRRCVDVASSKSRRAKRIINSRDAGRRQMQRLVRKLVVLTLYLRYLEDKRSAQSRKHREF